MIGVRIINENVWWNSNGATIVSFIIVFDDVLSDKVYSACIYYEY